MRNTRDMMKHAIKTPLWTFSGVILVLTFATYSIFKNRSNRDEYEGFILSPNVGDIYTIKTFQGNYTTYKVIKSTKDSVFVNQNQHETDKYSGLGRLRNKSTAEYDKKLISFSNQEIQRLYASDTLLSVQRSK
ncbi:MAG: hypothetical protein KJ941_08805 [Bacteroidetes bacterium]|nr:hypothetical protein [Bacteroidota bacterium]